MYGAGAGKPGEQENGVGKNGIYYDHKTNTWRSTSTGEEISPLLATAILFQTAMVSQFEEGNLSVLFNGKRLFVINEDKGSVVYSTLATSGRGEFMNNPSAQNISGKGPIPEGNYTFNNDQWNSQTTSRQLYNIIRGNGDWGDYNVPLTPLVPSSRNHFYLHGGFFEGSGGCIDAGSNIGIIYNYLKMQKTTIIRVRY